MNEAGITIHDNRDDDYPTRYPSIREILCGDSTAGTKGTENGDEYVFTLSR